MTSKGENVKAGLCYVSSRDPRKFEDYIANPCKGREKRPGMTFGSNLRPDKKINEKTNGTQNVSNNMLLRIAQQFRLISRILASERRFRNSKTDDAQGRTYSYRKIEYHSRLHQYAVTGHNQPEPEQRDEK